MFVCVSLICEYLAIVPYLNSVMRITKFMLWVYIEIYNVPEPAIQTSIIYGILKKKTNLQIS